MPHVLCIMQVCAPRRMRGEYLTVISQFLQITAYGYYGQYKRSLSVTSERNLRGVMPFFKIARTLPSIFCLGTM